MAPLAEQAESSDQFRHGSQQIADQHHHASLRQFFRDAPQDAQHACLVRGGRDIERIDNRLQVIALAASRHGRADAVIERDASHGVLLLEAEVSQAGRQSAGVLIFVERSSPIPHAGRDVDEQMAAEIRVFLELLHGQPVLPSPDLPIDMSQIVAGRIRHGVAGTRPTGQNRGYGASRTRSPRRYDGPANPVWQCERSPQDAKIFWNRASRVSSSSWDGVTSSNLSIS